MSINNKQILITGSSGFIGEYVVNEAIARGYKVLGFDINKPENANFDYIIGDITDKEAIAGAFGPNIYGVIHLAAMTSTIEFEANNRTVYDTNVAGFINVINLASKSGCKRFLYASTSGIYSDSFSENDQIAAGKLKNHYAKSKLMDEMIRRFLRHDK